MKVHRDAEFNIHAFCTSALDEDEWSVLRSSKLIPREKPLLFVEQAAMWTADLVWTKPKNKNIRLFQKSKQVFQSLANNIINWSSP
jgi:hypothetical protein